MTNRDNIIDVNDVERAMQQMGKAQQREAKPNGSTPPSVSTNELSIVESVTEFTSYIARFLERTAEEEITRTQQFAEHLRALATRVRQTGIGGSN